MSQLSAAQIRGYASEAGFTGKDLDIAVAVALAESGGNTNAHNPNPPDDSYGLWQINMLGSMGPERRKRFGLKANADLYDPATNARAAYGIFKGSGWKAWTTYTSGKYKSHMDGSTAIEAPSDEMATPATTDGGIVTGGLNALGSTLMHAFSNIGGVIIGVVLIILAFVILLMQSKTGKRVVKKGVGKVL